MHNLENNLINTLKTKSDWVRLSTLEMVINAGSGHLGGSFSVADILVSLLYNPELNFFEGEDKDRIILSKGHSSLSIYPILADKQLINIEELSNYNQSGSILGGHPDTRVPGIEITTGSLGHGLSVACGIALASKRSQKNSKIFAILGDGECQEGSVWESAQFASHHNLNNLTVIVDNNGISATDFTENTINIEPLEKKWDSFGWDSIVLNGHSIKDLVETLNKTPKTSKNPQALIAKTIKGKGVSFMENNPHFHHGLPNEEEIILAKKELSS